ncbi:MAG: hypothetical protein COA94_04780 [Rickettsiales bacterium]|nr:MAG: hypothetical protein COA94_04780 [Rickettsiales bacterium]
MPSGLKRVFLTPFDTVDTSDKEGVGTIRFEGSKIYKYIQYSEEAAAVASVVGEVAYYVAASGYANNDVTSDLSASDAVGAGVLQAILADNEYGWIQIKGYAVLTIALTAGADGDPLTPTGSADGALDVSIAVSDNVCATAGDISAQEIMCNFVF